MIQLYRKLLVTSLLICIGWCANLSSFATEMNGISSIAAGGEHSCALTVSGTARCWGANLHGQIGDGTTTQRQTAVDVQGLAGRATAISAGRDFTCALTSIGAVNCWGDNLSGQLGDGTATSRLTPVSVSGLSSGVTAIAAGNVHACAITSGGAVKCWGFNAFGQLGDNSAEFYRYAPVAVSGLSSGVKAIAAGEVHTCALTSGGAVKCWGANDMGQIGDGTTSRREVPVAVSGLANGVTAIAAGGRHTCALTSSGAVKCWGADFLKVPMSISGLASGITAIAAGYSHSCALTATGATKCWGANFYGQIGDGTTTRQNAPVDVPGLSATAIALGFGHTCAVTSVGSVKCWGRNFFSQIGNNTTVQRLAPVGVLGLESGVTAIAAGDHHTCAVTAGGAAKCWGGNVGGQIGDGTSTKRLMPTAVSGLVGGVAAIVAGYQHTCALMSGGAVMCWGSNLQGQLGDGTSQMHGTPADVLGLPTVTAIAAGDDHTCALTSGGTVKCWGRNNNGQLGNGTTTNSSVPVDVASLGDGVTAITAGASHTCALTTKGTVKCWGDNWNGKLGDNTTTKRTTPVSTMGLAGDVIAIAAGVSHTCALDSGGAIKCWGGNTYGQLGDTTTTQRLTPVDVPGLSATAIAAGGFHTCALTSDGAVKCWGHNYYGQLGDFSAGINRPVPVAVSDLGKGVTAIAAGLYHTCALASGGAAKCWGDNFVGQIGDGTDFGMQPFPAPVVLATQATNYSDSWWNSNESGWGITIIDHNTNAFVQWYTYDQTGHNQKYVIPGGTFSSNKCEFSGAIQHVSGPSWTSPKFDPSEVVRTTVGSGTINFCPTGLPAGTIVFDYNVEGITGSKQLTRLPFGNDLPRWGEIANTGAPDFTDLWWNSNESGWGVSVTQHGNNLFFRIFVYDTNGLPLLFVVPGVTMASAMSFTGSLQLTTGPWYGITPFDPNQVARITAGTATLTFSDANNGTLTYTVNGLTVTKAITRMMF